MYQHCSTRPSKLHSPPWIFPIDTLCCRQLTPAAEEAHSALPRPSPESQMRPCIHEQSVHKDYSHLCSGMVAYRTRTRRRPQLFGALGTQLPNPSTLPPIQPLDCPLPNDHRAQESLGFNFSDPPQFSFFRLIRSSAVPSLLLSTYPLCP